MTFCCSTNSSRFITRASGCGARGCQRVGTQIVREDGCWGSSWAARREGHVCSSEALGVAVLPSRYTHAEKV